MSPEANPAINFCKEIVILPVYDRAQSGITLDF